LPRIHTGDSTAPSYQKRIKLSIGDVASSAEPAHLQTLLGSCVAVCLHDPVLRAGGMNHILLPGHRPGDESQRYGIHAMELLINRLMSLGCDRNRLVAKAFGGANLLQQSHERAIGPRNAAFVRGFLSLERIPLIAERFGGNRALQVNFFTDTSRVMVAPVKSDQANLIAGNETSWKSTRKTNIGENDITLF
jgi:chemotaxis protein CheD